MRNVTSQDFPTALVAPSQMDLGTSKRCNVAYFDFPGGAYAAATFFATFEAFTTSPAV